MASPNTQAPGRQAGLEIELNHWRQFFAGGPSPRLQDLQNPAAPLFPPARDVLAAPPGATVHILDVGAGPISMLGTTWPDRKVHIQAIDPLADAYNTLLAEHNIAPRVRTQPGTAETLTDVFMPATFDLVFAVNSLDQCENPLLALQQALAVARPGSWVVSFDYENEAEMHHYRGLHQWNFTVEAGRFIVWNPQTRHDVLAELDGVAAFHHMKHEVQLPVHGTRHWLHTYLQKAR